MTLPSHPNLEIPAMMALPDEDLCLHRRSIAFSPLVYYVRLAWQQKNNSADRLPEHLTLPALPSKNVFLFASSITAVIMTPLWFLSGSINK